MTVRTIACEVCGGHTYGNRMPCLECKRTACVSCRFGNYGLCKECFKPAVPTPVAPLLTEKAR